MKHEEMRQFAEHLRTVHPGDFNMACWGNCLAAHATRYQNARNPQNLIPNYAERSMQVIFDVPLEDSHAMTRPYTGTLSPSVSLGVAMRKITPEDAYAMLTKYLDTGRVKWKELV